MVSQQNIEIFSRQMISEGCRFCEQIGNSPLGTLYRIVHPVYGNCVLKYFHTDIAKHRNFLKNFFLPLESIKQVEHPNLAKIYQLGAEEHAFIIRELILGVSLQERLNLQEKLPPIEATQLVLDIAMGLLAGYPFRVVYKNLKPNNVIVRPEGAACLVDMSLPPSDSNYIAPEQWSKKKSNIQSDIYALGVIYYQILAGKYLFPGASQQEIKKLHLTQSPTWGNLPDNLPSKIREIIRNMLAKNPEKRYSSPLPLIIALREALQYMGETPKAFTPPRATEANEIVAREKRGKEVAAQPGKGYTTMLVTDDIKRVKSEIKKAQSKAQNAQNEKIDDDLTQIVEREQLFAHQDDVEDKHKIEEVYIARRELEKTPDKALARITYIEDRQERHDPLPTRIVYFPKGFEDKVVKYLQKTFRRETWLLKELDISGQMEVEINLEKSYILRHFYQYEDQLQQEVKKYNQALQIAIEQAEQHKKITEELPPENYAVGDMQTIDIAEENIICLSEGDSSSSVDQADEDKSCGAETANDITINTRYPHTSAGEKRSKPTVLPTNFSYPALELRVNYTNAYETMAWCKFVLEHKLQKGAHFTLKKGEGDGSTQTFAVHLDKLRSYQKEQEHISRIKDFFHGDYDIVELDRGGMGAVLKLTARNDPTILFLRAENYWARQRYASFLHVVNIRGKEGVYAEFPKGTEFVVKVAFEGHEESLIREAMILSKVAEDSNVCNTIIGSVQQGRLFAADDQEQTRIGYYLMLEYALQGNTEQLYRRFPGGRLSTTTGFAIMYAMAQTLRRLKQLGIIHRDIKPQNILLDKNGVPKLSDFGLAITTNEASKNKITEDRRRLLRVMDDKFLRISRARELAQENLVTLSEKFKRISPEQRHQRKAIEEQIAQLKEKIPQLQEKEAQRAEALSAKYRPISAKENAMHGKFAGSLHFAAPEQFCLETVLDIKCDVYQLGASMYTLLTGKRPVEGRSMVEIMSRLLYPVKPEITDTISSTPLIAALSKLIHRMMKSDPHDRIDIDEVNEELDRLRFEHVLELKEPVHYPRPPAIDTEEQVNLWEQRVALAQELHKKCLKVIFGRTFASRTQNAF